MSYIQKLTPGKVLNLREEVPLEEEQMLSKTLVQRPDLGMTLFSVATGQEIGRHTATGDAMVNILSGIAKITINDQVSIVRAGETIVMPANIPHSLYAEDGFQMLLVVVKPEADA